MRGKYENSRRDSNELLKVNHLKEVAIVNLQMRIKKLQMDNRFLSARLDFTEKESTIFSIQDQKSAEQLSGLGGIYDKKKGSLGGAGR